MRVDREKLEAAARVLGQAAATIALRVLAWGATGAGVGLFAAVVLLASTALDAPPEWWRLARYLSLLVLPAGGALIFGQLGVARGIGRVVLRHAVDSGLVLEVLDRLLELAAGALARQPRLAALAERADLFAAELPLRDVELALKRAGDDFVLGADLEEGGGGARRWALRKIKRALVDKIEAYTLVLVRAEQGGVSLDRVRRLALDRAEEGVRELVLGAMKKQLLLAAGLLLSLVAVGPAVAAALRAA